MLTIYGQGPAGLSEISKSAEDLENAIWIDLETPTREEEAAVERALSIDVPTREEMQEIELSNRLYSEDDATFMTANILSHTDADDIAVSPMTLILHKKRLITVRYASPRTVQGFVHRSMRAGHWNADLLAIGLIEANIERCADIIERASADLDALSASIFLPEKSSTPDSRETAPKTSRGKTSASKVKKKRKSTPPRDFQNVLEEIGRKGELIAKIRDSLVSIQRLLTHYIGVISTGRPDQDQIATRLKSIARDVESLREHAGFMTQKVTFLLDATLGMINIEQNAIIKIFSVAAVIFLPPTLIASIYGMNFDFMPELNWRAGYPFAIGLMIGSALLPYWFFKRRGWL